MGYLDTSSDSSGPGSLVVLVLILMLYFAPTIVASLRHHQAGSVFVLNLFLGWTLIGWVVALALAVGSSRPPVIVQQQVGGPTMSPDGHFWWDGRAWQPMPGQAQTRTVRPLPPPQ